MQPYLTWIWTIMHGEFRLLFIVHPLLDHLFTEDFACRYVFLSPSRTAQNDFRSRVKSIHATKSKINCHPFHPSHSRVSDLRCSWIRLTDRAHDNCIVY